MPTADIKDSILDAIGGTPLVRLSRIGAELTPQLVAKVESLNPGGSIKDRVAVALIEAAERDGHLRPGGTIVEPTSGNTGTGLAIAAGLKGYQVIAVMPDKVSREKIDLLRAYGAKVVLCPTNVEPESPESYYSVSDRLAAEIPGAFKPDQYATRPTRPPTTTRPGPSCGSRAAARSPTSWSASAPAGRSPAPRATSRSAIPTSWSSARTRSARSTPPRPTDDVKGYLVEGVGEDFWPTTFDPSVVDRWIQRERPRLVPHHPPAGDGPRASWPAAPAASRCTPRSRSPPGIDDPEAMVAVILPDGGRSYLSKIYRDAWMTEYGFLERTGEDVRRRRPAAQARRHDPGARHRPQRPARP